MNDDNEMDIKRCTKCKRGFCEMENAEPAEVCGTCLKKKNEVQ